MAASHSVMEPGPSTGSMVVGDNDDNNNDDILTRAEAIELEEIARSPEHNKESREIAATLLQNDAQSRLTNVIAAVTNGEASPSVADRMLNAAERRVNHVGTMLDEIVGSRTTTPQSTTVVLPPYQQQTTADEQQLPEVDQTIVFQDTSNRDPLQRTSRTAGEQDHRQRPPWLF